MKITDVRAYPLCIPIKADDLPKPVIGATTPVIVKISTDEGITGAGEAWSFASALPTAMIIEASLKHLLVGKDPLRIEQLWQELYRATYYYGRAGIVLNAISGVEIALWDIAGRAFNIPVYQMLGGSSHEKLVAYASLGRYPNTEDVVDACKALKKKGYTAVKIHETETDVVGRARQALGDDTLLLVDANCKWDMPQAIEMGLRLKPFNLYWLEEPLWPSEDYEGLARVRAATSIPLATGENYYTAAGFREVLVKRAADFVQPSVFKIGGIIQSKKVFSMAGVFGVKAAPHCWSWGPAAAATLHVAFSEPGCDVVETCVDTPEASILTEPLVPENGYWKPLQAPGLGIELDEDALQKYRFDEELVVKHRLKSPDKKLPFW